MADRIIATILDPDGRSLGEAWFYKADVGPSRWLKIVVRYEATRGGRIVTAFARRSLP